MGAVAGLVGGGSNRGGSTITQQLVKNLTGEKQVSILRKVKEIFTALNMEGGYYQDGEYHSGYSNRGDPGDLPEPGKLRRPEPRGGGRGQRLLRQAHQRVLSGGVRPDRRHYPEPPPQYYPYYYPEQAKDRARTVLGRMLELSEEGELTDERLGEHHPGRVRRRHGRAGRMTFGGQEMPEEETTGETAEEAAQEREYDEKWNWYIDTMFEDIVRA